MYRLAKLQGLYPSWFVLGPITSNFLTYTCSSCKCSFVVSLPKVSGFVQNGIFVRSESTSIRTAPQASTAKKKKRKYRKKYAELLEVTQGSSSQRKALVSKLTPKHVSLLTQQPDINLSQLYSLKTLSSSTKGHIGTSGSNVEQGAVLFVPEGVCLENANERLESWAKEMQAVREKNNLNTNEVAANTSSHIANNESTKGVPRFQQGTDPLSRHIADTILKDVPEREASRHTRDTSRTDLVSDNSVLNKDSLPDTRKASQGLDPLSRHIAEVILNDDPHSGSLSDAAHPKPSRVGSSSNEDESFVHAKLSESFLSDSEYELGSLGHSREMHTASSSNLATSTVDDAALSEEEHSHLLMQTGDNIVVGPELEPELELELGAGGAGLKAGLPSDLDELEHGDEGIEDILAAVGPAIPAKRGPKKGKRTPKSASFPAATVKSTSSMKNTQREALAKVQLGQLEEAGRREGLVRNLLAYLDVCVNCKMLPRALSTFMFYRNRQQKHRHKTPSPIDIRVYEVLLHGFAGKGELGQVQKLMEQLQQDGLLASPQSLAACLECVGRLPERPQHQALATQWLQQLEALGCSPSELFTRCVFVGDQKQAVVAAIHLVQPDFQLSKQPPDSAYTCGLLHSLNRPLQDAQGSNGGFTSPGAGVLSAEQLWEAAQEQLRLEVAGSLEVQSIEAQPDPSPTVLTCRDRLLKTQEHWRHTFAEAFARELKLLKAQTRTFRLGSQLNLYPYLCVLDSAQYADIVIQEIRRLAEGSETFSPTTLLLYRELGQQVCTRYEAQCRQNAGVVNKLGQLYQRYCQWYAQPSGPSRNTREEWLRLAAESNEGPDVWVPEKRWPAPVLISVGKFLYNIILRDIKIDVNASRASSKAQRLLPAFYTLFRAHGRVLKEEVKPHPALARLYRAAQWPTLTFETALVPMLAPPLPWVPHRGGGPLLVHADLIRLPYQATQQQERMDSAPAAQLLPALDALNQLGSVPWTVNESLLDVVLEVFKSGGSSRLDVPQPPSACPAPPTVTDDMDKGERALAYRQRMALRRRRAEMYSLWCDTLYRLSLANHFRGRVFWLPHNMDFRGRVYPVAPHLSHLASDLARSLLQFAQGQPLGPDGLRWLKLHLVNLTGTHKRMSLDQRLEYAEEMMPEVLDSSDRPLTGRMWWARSEEPWQTLACCMEVARATRSGNPEAYVTRFPVHQDGSCNGLQHYAALGRDLSGAESVNLAPSEKPQDVYSCVAALVERERAKDAEAGMKVAQVLEGFVFRKVIKQTVMTTVYGVTRFGARLQIARQLKDIEEFPPEYVWAGSMYLVGKTFSSLREMFTSTREIQDWFTDCARHIAQVCGQHVEWVTPLGLPVVQPYTRPLRRTEPAKLLRPRMQEHFHMDMFERPNVMKQKNAFPPNFIHSLDSSHMMLTSLFCEQAGITFVSVHDCYWTHPSTVATMSKICREQFVALHSQPILEELSQFLVNRFSYSSSDINNDNSLTKNAKIKLNSTLEGIPKKGDFDLHSVLKSVYFFS